MKSSTHPVITHCLIKMQEFNALYVHNAGFQHCIPDIGSRLYLLNSLQSEIIPDDFVKIINEAHEFASTCANYVEYIDNIRYKPSASPSVILLSTVSTPSGRSSTKTRATTLSPPLPPVVPIPPTRFDYDDRYSDHVHDDDSVFFEQPSSVHTTAALPALPVHDDRYSEHAHSTDSLFFERPLSVKSQTPTVHVHDDRYSDHAHSTDSVFFDAPISEHAQSQRSTTSSTSSSVSAVSDDGMLPIINHEHPPTVIQAPDFHDIAEEHRQILHHFHYQSNHLGVNRTLTLLKNAGYFWSSMQRDLVAFIQSCPYCQLTWRIPRARNILNRTFLSYDPFYAIAMDFMGPFEPDTHGHIHYCCVVDVFSRYLRIFPTKDCTAKTAAICLLNIYSQFTLPRIVCTDQGKAFTSNLFRHLLLFISADPSYSIAYRHQTSIERPQREVVRHAQVLHMTRRDPRDQSCLVLAPLMEKIINNVVHTDTKCSAHELLFGIHSSPIPPPNHDDTFELPKPTNAFVQSLLQNQLRLLDASRMHQAENTDLYLLPNTSRENFYFAPGQFVVALFPNNTPPRKHHERVLGPFQVLARDDEKYTVLDLLDDTVTHTFHFTRLRLYSSSDYHHISPRDAALLNSKEFEVQDILRHRGNHKYRSKLQFLVSFTGYDSTYNEWLPCNSVCRHPKMNDYLLKYPHLSKTVRNFKDNAPVEE